VAHRPVHESIKEIGYTKLMVSGALMLKTKRMQRLQKMTEEEKKAMNEIDILKKNVADLQRQYQETLIKIKKLQEEK
jgi:hypothetical protein